jgi:hypothetical protein
MPEDPTTANVTARIIFRGVMLMCINRNNHCEVGVIPCPQHKPEIKIQTHTSGGTVSDDPRPITNDLFIQVVNPTSEGVTRRNEGDNQDFRFVPDLEGGIFHGDKVNVFPERFRARLAVNAGLLHSPTLLDELEIIQWSEDNIKGTRQGRFIRIAHDVTLNIDCRDGRGSGINIIDTVTRRPIRELPKLSGTTYTIVIDNDCRGDDLGPDETDFRLYYKVIESRDGKRFDVLKRDVTAPAPRACETGLLGTTDTFGFSFEPQENLRENQKRPSKPDSK